MCMFSELCCKKVRYNNNKDNNSFCAFNNFHCIHMPRGRSRTFLCLTGVKLPILNSIGWQTGRWKQEQEQVFFSPQAHKCQVDLKLRFGVY